MWHTTDERPPVTYTAEEAAAMDAWLAVERGFTVGQLMEHAGTGLAEAVRELVEARGLGRIVWMVGPGHNGGDALVARRRLEGRLPDVLWRPLDDEPPPDLAATTLLVDGVFGVGLARAIGGAARAAVEHVNDSSAVVLAVDVPSGLSATTGEVVGCTPEHPDGGVAVRAAHTLTFVGPKTGFFLEQGPAHVGLWRAVPIGFPVEEAEEWVRARRTDV